MNQIETNLISVYFKRISVYPGINEDNPILSNISGYIKKSGITAGKLDALCL